MKTVRFWKVLVAWTERAYRKNQVTCEFSAVYLKRSDRNGCRKLPVMNKKERSPIMLKKLEIFYDSSTFFFKFHRGLYGKPLKRDWVVRVVFPIQILLIFGSRCGLYFCWDIRLKTYRLPNFNVLFKFLLTIFIKSELFSCLQKVDHVIN